MKRNYLLVWMALSICWMNANHVMADEPSALARLAGSMKSGSWAELKTEGYNAELFAKHDILVYSDKAVWDPKSRQVLFVGQDHLRPPPRFIVYQEGTNAWKAMPTPKWAEPLKWFHAYENNAIDAKRGVFYHHPSSSLIVHRYDIAADKWSTLPEISKAGTGHGTALEYFPEAKGLVRVLNGRVHFFDEEKETWSVLSDKLTMGPYHNVAAYLPHHKVVVLGGGNGSSDLYRMDADRKITPLKKGLRGIGIGQSILVPDPTTGALLLFHKDRSFHSYDSAKDAWREEGGSTMPFPVKESSHHVVAAPISTHGVVMFIASPGRGGKILLYRHEAGK